MLFRKAIFSTMDSLLIPSFPWEDSSPYIAWSFSCRKRKAFFFQAAECCSFYKWANGSIVVSSINSLQKQSQRGLLAISWLPQQIHVKISPEGVQKITLRAAWFWALIVWVFSVFTREQNHTVKHRGVLTEPQQSLVFGTAPKTISSDGESKKETIVKCINPGPWSADLLSTSCIFQACRETAGGTDGVLMNSKCRCH